MSSSAGLKRGFCSLFTSPLSVALLFLIEISVAFIFFSLKLAYSSSARDCRNRVVHSIQYSQLRTKNERKFGAGIGNFRYEMAPAGLVISDKMALRDFLILPLYLDIVSLAIPLK